MNFADLEIHLRATDDDNKYDVHLNFTRPDDDSEIDLGQFQPLTIDFKKFQALEGEQPADYGAALGEALFADKNLCAQFSKFRGIAEEHEEHEEHDGTILRLRLFIESEARKLHVLRWETLTDPESPDKLLATNQNILFSRYLSSQDTKPVRLRRPSETRALLFIANPSDLTDYKPGGRQLQQVDVAGESERVTAALKPMQVNRLKPGQHATLNDLMDSLRVTSEKLSEGVSVLYLVCHGALIDGEPYLALENSEGKTAMTPGAELVNRLRELQRRPRLIVLASCQSAGEGTMARSDDGGVLAALGPQLADAGIPAVLAMQGNVTMETVKRFMPVFFKQLRRHGVIDLALSVARGEVRERADWWVPALFMRLKSGRIWSGTEASVEESDFDGWPELLDSILAGKCTPILGPRLADPLAGSRREIAQKLAEEFDLPLAEYDRDDLPEVLQYLQVRDKEDIAPRAMLRSLCKEMMERCDDCLPPELFNAAPDELVGDELTELFARLEKAVWEKKLQENPREPHLVLAQLPFTIYLMTTPDGLLTKALKDDRVGKKPVVDICRWNDLLAELPSYTADEQVGDNYYPSLKRPFVFHFFGLIEKPRFLTVGQTDPSKIKSAVLTEDDYFDFLLGFGRRNNSDNNTINSRQSNYVPTFVRSAMTSHKLLFLGFQMNEWSFRVLFRSIKIMEGHAGLSDKTHIAVQIEPDEGQKKDLEKARNYLSKYFSSNDVDIRFYWGPIENFVRELYTQWFSE